MTSKSKSEKWLLDYLLLSLVLLLYGINIYYLTSLDFEPPKWDEAVHLRDSLVFFNVLSNPSQITPKVINDIINKSEQYPLLRPSGYYPPFTPMLTSIFYFIFGTSSKVAVMSNMIFLLISVFSIYKIGIILFNRKIALLASVLILLFPIILSNSIVYMLDLPLTAMVALGIFTLIKTNYFKNTRFSIISGIAFGLGILTKWTFLFFILGPLSYSVLNAFYQERSLENVTKKPFQLRKTIRNIILFSVASVVTFGPYYFPILPSLIKETIRYSHGVVPHGQVSLLSFASILFYPVALWRDMITSYGLILFTIGTILLFVSRSSYKTFLIIWTFVPYIIFTFIVQIKQPRYMMPWLVPISLIISHGISEFGNFKVLGIPVKIKNYLVSLSLIIFLIFFLIEDLRLRNSIIRNSEEDWKIEEIVSVLERDLKEGDKIKQLTKTPKYLGVIPDHRYINGQTIRYYATLRRLPLNVIKLQNYKGTALQEFVDRFNHFDYLLTKNISNSAITSYQKSIDDMHNFFYSNINQFENLLTINETDGSQISIYKRKKPTIEKNNKS